MEVRGKKTREEIKALAGEALRRRRDISVQTYYLTDYGEMVLNAVAETILERNARTDLLDLVYTALKELVMNAAKANLKRIILDEEGLDPSNPDDYTRCMQIFKASLPERKLRQYKRKFREYDLPVRVTFRWSPYAALRIRITNRFTLLAQEEERVREKFRYAQNYTDLVQFYMDHGDDTEGAGMGITLVVILMDQLGVDRRLFSVYSDDREGQTVARLEIPLTEYYEPERLRFEREFAASELPRDEFRQRFLARRAEQAPRSSPEGTAP